MKSKPQQESFSILVPESSFNTDLTFTDTCLLQLWFWLRYKQHNNWSSPSLFPFPMSLFAILHLCCLKSTTSSILNYSICFWLVRLISSDWTSGIIIEESTLVATLSLQIVCQWLEFEWGKEIVGTRADSSLKFPSFHSSGRRHSLDTSYIIKAFQVD